MSTQTSLPQATQRSVVVHLRPPPPPPGQATGSSTGAQLETASAPLTTSIQSGQPIGRRAPPPSQQAVAARPPPPSRPLQQQSLSLPPPPPARAAAGTNTATGGFNNFAATIINQQQTQDPTVAYVSNHIFNAVITFVPQLGSMVRFGGQLRITNMYNSAHLIRSTLYVSEFVPLIDVIRSGTVEMVGDAFDEEEKHSKIRARSLPESRQLLLKDIDAECEPIFGCAAHRHSFLTPSREAKFRIKYALAVHHLLLDNILKISGASSDFSLPLVPLSIESTFSPHHTASSVAVSGGFRAGRFVDCEDMRLSGRPYGMRTTAGKVQQAFEMMTCNDQPPMRHGHMQFVHRGRIVVVGGTPAAAVDDNTTSDIDTPTTPHSDPTILDIASRRWTTWKAWIPRFHTAIAEGFSSSSSKMSTKACLGCHLVRPAFTHMTRHSDADEAVVFAWGGYDSRGARTPRAENHDLFIGWIFPTEPQMDLYSNGRAERPVSEKAPIHFERLPVAPNCGAPSWEVGQYHVGESGGNAPSAGAFLVVTNCMPPPSFAQYQLMRTQANACGYDRSRPWEVLHLFKASGEVWSLPISAGALHDSSLRWTRVTKHFGLPSSIAVSLRGNPANQALQAQAKQYCEDELSRLNVVGVIPRARFSYNLVPNNLYPDVSKFVDPTAPTTPNSSNQPSRPELLGLSAIPFPPTSKFMLPPLSGSCRASSNYASHTDSAAMQADTEFIIVTVVNGPNDGTAPRGKPTLCTTFIPSLGYAVNERYRVRVTDDTVLYGAAVVTPHFIRPRATPDVQVPLSDSRYIPRSNVQEKITASPNASGVRKLIKLPTPRTFSAIVTGVRCDGDDFHHGAPVATYITRSPMTLKEMVAQVALRFFPFQEALAEAVRKRNAILSEKSHSPLPHPNSIYVEAEGTFGEDDDDQSPAHDVPSFCVDFISARGC